MKTEMTNVLDRLADAIERRRQIMVEIEGLCAQLSAQLSGQKSSPPAGKPRKRKAGPKATMAKAGGVRRMECPRCGVEVDCTSRVGPACPVPHKDPEGLACVKLP